MRNIKLLADIVVDLDRGDSGKGKVTNSLLKSGEYTHCVRFSGGHNAGHTIFHNGKKIVTHVVPSGVLQGVKCIIGPGCVVNPGLLEEEIRNLESEGIKVRELLFIDKRTNIITGAHLYEDSQDTKIGTTKKGNGPAYRDKHARKGMRFGDVKHSDLNIIDVYDEFFNNSNPVVALFEGSQGFFLDIDWGDYPYVTSSTCTVGGAINNGIPPSAIRKIFGVTKAYRTYVGAKSFQPAGEIFHKICKTGGEYGATTGRVRQVDYLDLNELVQASRINGITNLIINKTDILNEVNEWKLYKDGTLINLEKEDVFKSYIKEYINDRYKALENIVFSYSPNDI